MKCFVCKQDVKQVGIGRPREYHPACKEYRNSLDRAAKALLRIEFPDDEEQKLEVSRCLKFELIEIINSLPTRHYSVRDKGGRFAKRCPSETG